MSLEAETGTNPALVHRSETEGRLMDILEVNVKVELELETGERDWRLS
jgi:hypothetical protein